MSKNDVKRTFKPLFDNQFENFKPDYKLSDYDKIIKEFTKVKDEDDSSMETSTAINTYNYLHDAIPVNESETLLGIEVLEPSDFEKSIWLRKHYIAMNPNKAYDMINSGNIGMLEMSVLKELYPDMLSNIQSLATEGLVDFKQANKKLSLKQEFVLMSLFETVKVRQEVFGEKEDEKGGKIEINAENAMTDVQQTLSN